MSQRFNVMKVMHIAVFALLVIPFASLAISAAPAYAVTVPPLDPAAPVATFDFSATTEANQQFVVNFDAPVDPIDAVNASHYFLVHTDTTLSKSSLAGFATVTYDVLSQTATVTLTDPTLTILDERVSVGVQGVKAQAGESLVAQTIGSAVLLITPGQPGIPVVTSTVNDKSIVWSWTAAVDGGEYASGINFYSYELVKDGIVVASGTTSADILTATTLVTKDGTYTLRVWATDKAGNIGEPSESSDTTIATLPVDPEEPVDPVEEPQPPVVEPKPSVVEQPPAPTKTYSTPTIASNAYTYAQDTTTDTVTNDASVLSAETAATSVTNNAPTTEKNAAAASANGDWKILGLVWYAWLLILAIIVTAWLWGRSVGRGESSDK